jgi:hypothetical protein
MPQHIRLCPSLDQGNHFYGSPDSLGNRYCEFCFAPLPKVKSHEVSVTFIVDAIDGNDARNIVSAQIGDSTALPLNITAVHYHKVPA